MLSPAPSVSRPCGGVPGCTWLPGWAAAVTVRACVVLAGWTACVGLAAWGGGLCPCELSRASEATGIANARTASRDHIKVADKLPGLKQRCVRCPIVNLISRVLVDADGASR